MVRIEKIFLIFMLFLLPLQYTWAIVANYDTHHAHDSQAHFGHHEHQTTLIHETNHEKNHSDIIHSDLVDVASDNEGGTNTQAAKVHDHFGFLHLSCLELLSHDLPIFAFEAKQFSIQYLFTYHSPPNYQPERPNWITPV